MASKTEESYQRVLREFFKLPLEMYNVEAFISGKFKSQVFYLNMFPCLDYETAPTKVMSSLFPNSRAIRCVFHLSQSVQRWSKQHRLAYFYSNEHLKEWIILFSKLAYLPERDVLNGYGSLLIRKVKTMQLESEQRIHSLVAEWIQERNNENWDVPNSDNMIYFLRSVQDSLWHAAGMNLDVDEILESDEENEEIDL